MNNKITSTTKYLFKKRKRKFILLYLLAGLLLFLIGAMGSCCGAPYFYWPLSIICVAEIIYPTIFIWGIIFGIYLIGSIIYIGFTISELIKYGHNSMIYSDGVLYFFYVGIIILFSILLFISRPRKLSEKER
ncbi:MAG: hypothetical protein NT106_12465 [Candidatus Sumerlaeota bacterium]|nr:hypothetical protein [Candidatus Sumerlaeota bacterium]